MLYLLIDTIEKNSFHLKAFNIHYINQFCKTYKKGITIQKFSLWFDFNILNFGLLTFTYDEFFWQFNFFKTEKHNYSFFLNI